MLYKRSLAGGGQRKGTSCCLLPLSSFLLWFPYFLSLVSHFILCLWPSSHHCSCVSCSFGLCSVYSGHVWVWQISLLDLAVVGNPDSSTASYSLCWLKTDYQLQRLCNARPGSIFPSISHPHKLSTFFFSQAICYFVTIICVLTLLHISAPQSLPLSILLVKLEKNFNGFDSFIRTHWKCILDSGVLCWGCNAMVVATS